MNAKSTWSSVATLFALAAASSAWAQDPAVVGQNVYKCPFENEQSRLCEIVFKPGEKIARHSHPEHLVYVLQPGTLRITDDATGESSDVEFAAGQAVWIPAVTHHAVNVGDTEVKAILVEFKNSAATSKKKDKPAKD